MTDFKQPKKVLAYLNTVVDYIYPKDGVNEELMEKFHHEIPRAKKNPEMEVPRSDDTTPMLQSELNTSVKGALSDMFNGQANAQELIFGRASRKAAGGSLGNTMAPLLGSSVDGMPVIDGKILTNLPETEDAEISTESYPDGAVLDYVRQGECLTVHVVPYHDGRSQFPTLHDGNPSNTNMSPYLFKELKDGFYDEFFIEGFTAAGPHFEHEAQTILTAITSANMIRERLGKEPMKLVITAGAQFICENPAYRKFVEDVTKVTPVRIHANTGEFRRLLDNDEDWRKEAQKGFTGLKGRALEAAKKASKEYRAAKTQANLDTIQKAMSTWGMATKHALEFVVTDGGNDGYVVNNDNYLVVTPEPLDPSTIVNKVGAGDAFMAGYTLAVELGLDQEQAMKAGGVFARHVLQQEDARPVMPSRPNSMYGYGGAAGLLALHGLVAPSAGAQAQRFSPEAFG